MRRSTDVFVGFFRNLPILRVLIWLFVVFIGMRAVYHFSDSFAHQREVLETDPREAKMPEPQIQALSGSVSLLETEVRTVVTGTFMASTVFFAIAYLGGNDQSSRKPRAKIKDRPDRPEGNTA